MLWKAIALIICDRTRPPHQSNDEYYTSTPNTSNYGLIMTDRSKQIIPESRAVTHFEDSEILKILNSHSTFTISDLLEMLRGASLDSVEFVDRAAFIEKLTNIITQTIQQGHSQQYLMNKVSTLVKGKYTRTRSR